MEQNIPPSSNPVPEPDASSLAILDCLREAVAEELERKRRLGQYWVEWTPENGMRFIGPDAPSQPSSGRTSAA